MFNKLVGEEGHRALDRLFDEPPCAAQSSGLTFLGPIGRLDFLSNVLDDSVRNTGCKLVNRVRCVGLIDRSRETTSVGRTEARQGAD